MADKKVTIGLSIEVAAALKKMEQEFAASVKKIQQDFAGMKVPVSKIVTPQQDAFQKAGGGGAGVEAFRAHTQATNQMTQRGMQEASINRAKIDILAKEKTFRDEILKIEQKITAEKQAQVKANQQPRGGSAGGGSTTTTFNTGQGGFAGGGMMGVALPVILGTVTAMVSKIYETANRSAMMSASSTVNAQSSFGSAMQGTVGKDVAALYNGRTPFNAAFKTERQASYEEASKIVQAQKSKDLRDLYANPILGGMAGGTAGLVGGTAAGAYLTAGTLGLAAPFTMAAGMGGGAALGALGGAGAGMMSNLSDPRLGPLARSMMPGADPKWAREYSAQNAHLLSEQQQKSLQGQLDSQPERVAAAEDFYKNSQRNLDFQRQMGIGEKEFRTNFTGGGFTQEQNMAAASGIMAAGGTTLGARGGAVTANQAQRAFDLTNAPQVMGKLSGTLGTSELSKEALIKIQSEGTRIGVNQADFVEENRKFVEMAANVISQSGATSGADVDQMMNAFGKFFGGEKTTAGMEAGKSAFDVYRQMSMAQTGPVGTMRAGGMMTDPILSKLSSNSAAALFRLPVDQLRPGGATIEALADEAGVSSQQLIDAANKNTASSANKYSGSDAAINQLKGMQFVGTDKGRKLALGKAALWQLNEHEEFGTNTKAAEAMAQSLATGDTAGARKALEGATRTKLEGAGTDRPGDTVNAMQAEISKITNKMFTDMRDQIIPAATEVENMTKKWQAFTAALRSLPASQQPAYWAAHAHDIIGDAPTVPSSGSTSSGSNSMTGK